MGKAKPELTRTFPTPETAVALDAWDRRNRASVAVALLDALACRFVLPRVPRMPPLPTRVLWEEARRAVDDPGAMRDQGEVAAMLDDAQDAQVRVGRYQKAVQDRTFALRLAALAFGMAVHAAFIAGAYLMARDGISNGWLGILVGAWVVLVAGALVTCKVKVDPVAFPRKDVSGQPAAEWA